MHRPKVLTSLLCAAAVVIVAVIPVAAQVNQVNGEPRVTLRYSTWAPPTPENLAVLEAFHQVYPDIRVEYRQRSTSLETLIPQMLSSEPPDVIDLSYSVNIDWVYAAGMVRPIDDLVARDGFDVGRFIPGTLEYAYYKGQLMGLPRSLGSSSLGTSYPIYNRRHFDEGGVAYPADDWTFDDLVSIGKKLTRISGDGTVSQWGLSTVSASNAHLWIWSAGGEVLSSDLRTSRLLEEEAIEGLQFLVDLIHTHGVMAPVGVSSSFTAQRSAIQPNVSTTGAMNNYKYEYPELDWSFAAMPRGPRSESGYAQIGSHVVTISATTPHVEEAWTFLKFLSSREYQEYEYYVLGKGTPHLLELAQERRFLYPDGPPWNLEVILNAGARPVPRTMVWSEHQALLAQLLNSALRGEGDIRTLIEGNIDRINALLRSVE